MMIDNPEHYMIIVATFSSLNLIQSFHGFPHFLVSEQLQILLLMGDAEGAAAVARGAVQRHSQSVSVWLLSLQTLIELESRDVGQLFKDAFAHIDPKVGCSFLTVTWSLRF